MTQRDREAIASVIKAYDVRGVVGDGIDADLVRDTGAAFGLLMRGEGATRVVIGHDMRDSSPGLSDAFAEGVRSQGLDTVSLGLTSTDELYFASGTMDCPGAMFTASHNPARYNGIKLCRSGARPVGQQTGLAEVSDMLVDGVPSYDGTAGTGSSRDVLTDYAAFLHDLVPLEIRPLTVAVDAGNGMGGLTVPAVLGEGSGLPLSIRDLYFELDGTFPNHEANPWLRRTSSTCRSTRWPREPTWVSPSTVTPTAASSSTSRASQSRHLRSAASLQSATWTSTPVPRSSTT